MKQLRKVSLSYKQLLTLYEVVSNIVTIAGCVDVAAKIDINEYEQTELHRDYESLNEYLSQCYPQRDEEVEKIIREIHLEVEEVTKSSAETVLQLLCLMHFTCLLMKIYNREILEKIHKNIDAKAKELKKFLSKYCHVPVLLITN